MTHDSLVALTFVRVCGAVWFGRQDCVQQVAATDHEKRLQAEAHAQQKTQLAKERDAALVAVGSVYACDRASHKAVNRAIKSLAEVEQHARLAQGAAQQLAWVAHRAVAAAPAEQRAALAAQLAPPSMALSASRHGMAQSASRASSEIVASSKQVRQLNKSVHAHMPGY